MEEPFLNYEQTLEQLCSLSGPSGFEQPVARAAAELLRPWVEEVTLSPAGVLGVLPSKKTGAKKLLLDAHLDEVGLIVTGHEEGFLTFASLGGVDPRILPDREVLILTEPPMLGVVACLPPHIQTREDMDKAQPMKELYLDVGLSQEEAQRLIPVGTPVVCRGSCQKLGEDLLWGKAMDDRACFALLLHTLELLKGQELDVDLYVLGSAQEETHSTGAITAAYGVVPDLCVAVDVTHGDSPDAGKNETFKLGGGPVLGLGPNCTRWMAKRMEDKAKELDMDIQKEVMSGSSGTNGWPLQVSREGIATAVLSIPLRYMHTHMETVCRWDLEDAARLLAAFIQGIGKEVPSYD